MAITSDLLRISVRGSYLGQRVEVIQSFAAGGAGLATASCENVAEAFWDHIKDAWRVCHVPSSLDRTISILCEEIGGSLGFGEYPIDIAEQEGFRDASGSVAFLPPYVAIAARLTVGTRLTRPGQKRFWGALEPDNDDGILGGDLYALVDELLSVWTLPIGLGVPAATVGLDAEIVTYDRVTGEPGNRQLVTGYLINTNLSSQNSRKFGRGT